MRHPAIFLPGRILDRYRFRWAMTQGIRAPALTRDDSLWWRDLRYFTGGA
ncbi:MAG: hypothetical protein ACRDYX_05800 [Egibacteraceae bacterium]